MLRDEGVFTTKPIVPSDDGWLQWRKRWSNIFVKRDLAYEQWLDSFKNKPTNEELIQMHMVMMQSNSTHKSLNNPNFFPKPQGA